MRTTHTPAPWLFDRYAGRTAHFCNRSGSDILKANESIGDDERAANVRLVKAAPDLLDALRECAAALATARAFHKGRPPWVETDGAALVAARAAIDKAIGG